MTRFVSLDVPTVGATVIVMAVFGTGVAAATPDVTGEVCGDAQKTLKTAGYTATVATRVGDQLPDERCVVDRV